MIIYGTVSFVKQEEKDGKVQKSVSIENFSLLASDVPELPAEKAFIKANVSTFWKKGSKRPLHFLDSWSVPVMQ